MCFTVATAFTAKAQFDLTPSTDMPVLNMQGSPMPNPWTGGINAAQLSMFDADGDGINDDIFIFDRSGHRVLVFLGNTANGQRQYRYAPEYGPLFPASLRHWALLRDYNCDGKMDIFTQSPLGGGIAVYENSGEYGASLEFEQASILLFSRAIFQNSQPNPVNLYTSPTDIPAIVDMDGDGDLDIFTFSVTGTQLEYHENRSVDSTGTCGLGVYRTANLCYGQFAEGSETNDVTLGVPCSFNVVNPKSDEGLRHVGTTILAEDFTADGLRDLVLGGVGFNNLTYLENSVGLNGKDSIVHAETDFPHGFGGIPVDIDNFAAAFYEDLTGNGVRDLVVGVNEAFTASNTESLWFYENLGDDNAPIFSYIQDNFLQDGTIDHGEVAAPSFADVTGNGLTDMVIGSRGVFTGGTTFVPSLALYTNVGTATEPVFQLTDSNWLQVSQLGLGQYVHPSFGDIDGDGDLDLVIGDLSGRVFLFLNTAGAGNPMQFELGGALSADGAVIDVGQLSTPQLYDLDQDGKVDLIIGERNGNLNYYRNTGGPGGFGFTLMTDTLGGVDVIEFGFFIGNSAPHFYRYEGVTFLMVGVEQGRLYHYSNIDGNEMGTYQLESSNAFGVTAGEKSRPAVLDMNNDGYPELFCGSIGGGVLFYKGGAPLFTENTDPTTGNRLQLYPNPAITEVRIRSKQSTFFEAYRMYSLSGKLVDAGRVTGGDHIQLQGPASGVYIVEVIAGPLRERALLMVK